jgi:hypothetical protein
MMVEMNPFFPERRKLIWATPPIPKIGTIIENAVGERWKVIGRYRNREIIIEKVE